MAVNRNLSLKTIIMIGLRKLYRASTQVGFRIVKQGLQMWHKMIPDTWTGSNRLPDDSGNSNTAALYTGRGLSFDGVNDVVTIGNTGQTVKTVVFYVYPDTTTEVFMQLQSAGAVRIEIASGTLSATGFTSPTLYVNGVAGSTVAATTWQMIAVTSATGVSASNVLLGQSNTDYGSIDMSNVKFFSTELTAGQIAELYANPEQVLPTGVSGTELVGWWTMSEGAGGIALNSIVGGNAGKTSGATYVSAIVSPTPQWSLKSGSRPMVFDGSDDYVALGSTSTLSGGATTFSVMAVGYTSLTSGASDQMLISKRTGSNPWDMRIRHAAGVPNGISSIWNTSGGSVTLNGTASVNRLVHAVLTYDGSNVRLYINGVLADTEALTGTINTNGANVNIGRAPNGTLYLTGMTVEAAMWSNTLSASEITAIYAAGQRLDLDANSGDYASSGTLLGWWRNGGNQNTGWLDLSGNDRNGTVNGSPVAISVQESTTTGTDAIVNPVTTPNTGELILHAAGYALATDAATLDITTNITLEAWVKPFTVAANQTAIGKNNAYALNITSGAKLQFQRWNGTTSGTVNSSANLSPNTWHHIAATYDGTTTKLYIDGVEDTSIGTLTGTIDGTATDVLMGALTSSTQNFSGYLDNVRVYDEVKTASNILNNYNVEKNNYI